MKLVQLVYASTMANALSMEEIVSILDAARASNQRHHITGAMTFSNLHFLQLLEGPPLEVNALYARLMRDPRHVDLALIGFREVSTRLLPDWSMAYFRLAEKAPAVFEPHAFSMDDALAHLSGLPAPLHALV